MSLRRALAWTLALTTVGTLALTLALGYALYVALVVVLGVTPPFLGPWPEPDGFWSTVVGDPWLLLGPAVPWWIAGCVVAVLVLLWRRNGSTAFAREAPLRQGAVAATLTLAPGSVVFLAVAIVGT
jgi:hypothetical protein